jgi:type I restriction enzyme, S subunit
MSFPRYPKYKESGVEWLGDVPEHWSVISLKWLSPVQRGASPRPIEDEKYFDDEGEFAWVRIADVSASNGRLKETTQRLSKLGSSLSVKMYPGQLFISIAGTVGKPCITEIDACIHDGFVYFPTLKLEPMFLYRIFESGTCYGGLGKWGTQLNLNTDTIGSIRIAVPPENERALLLTFLDRETGKIDALVAEQRRLIELLKEKRQAVISHAVTKGLDPTVKLKPSGIEWLGDVPEHWEVTKIKHVIRSIEQGWSPQCEGFPVESPNQWGVLKVGCVNSGIFDASENKVLPESLEPIPSLAIAKGDLLISRANTRELVGRAAVAESDFPNLILCDKLYRLRVQADICDPVFLSFYLSSDRARGPIEIAASGASASMVNIGQSVILEMAIALPPAAQQNLIVERIEEAGRVLNTLTTEAERAIELLQERRTALISAAVTGKIDVRQQVPSPIF